MTIRRLIQAHGEARPDASPVSYSSAAECGSSQSQSQLQARLEADADGDWSDQQPASDSESLPELNLALDSSDMEVGGEEEEEEEGDD